MSANEQTKPAALTVKNAGPISKPRRLGVCPLWREVIKVSWSITLFTCGLSAADHNEKSGGLTWSIDVPAIARVPILLHDHAPSSEAALDHALATSPARQRSTQRMDALLHGELSVYQADSLVGQEKIDWLERAARSGDAAAAAALADKLDNGVDLQKDETRAFAYYLAAALGGRMDAAHNVGAAYASGRGVRPNVTDALAWLIVARERGDQSGAEEQLRNHLKARDAKGIIAAAETRAAEWISKAPSAAIVTAALPPAGPLIFEASERAAEDNLIVELDATGEDIPSAVPEVVVLTIFGERFTWPTLAALERAAARDNPAALAALGRLLVAGKQIPADPLRAVVLLERSAAAGNVDAAHQLGELYSDGEKLLRDDVKAFTYFEKAARGGSPLAIANVGVYLTNGRGTPRDPVNGLAWLIVAKQRGVDLGQESRLRGFLAQRRPADLAKAELAATKLHAELEKTAPRRK